MGELVAFSIDALGRILKNRHTNAPSIRALPFLCCSREQAYKWARIFFDDGDRTIWIYQYCDQEMFWLGYVEHSWPPCSHKSDWRFVDTLDFSIRRYSRFFE